MRRESAASQPGTAARSYIIERKRADDTPAKRSGHVSPDFSRLCRKPYFGTMTTNLATDRPLPGDCLGPSSAPERAA